MKMAALVLLLFSSGALLCSCNAQESNYNELSEVLKSGVDLALEKLHSLVGIQQHLRFLRSHQQSDIQAGFGVTYIYHHFDLKATNCKKGTADPTSCQFRNDRPLMDCAVCYKTFEDKIEPEPKPYVHCVRKQTLTAVMRAARVEHCNQMGYNSGSPTLLASVGS